ncbi:MAG: heme NO-binding domain-containing protein [Planctomycetota bacterium]
MKGSIFKHFETFLRSTFGDELCEQVLEHAQRDHVGPYLGPEIYPDGDMFALVGETLSRTGLALPAALQAFGRYLFDRLCEDAPHLVSGRQTLDELLASLDRVIHVEVQKLSPGTYLPRIGCTTTGEGHLELSYRSRRNLCPLFLGLLHGAAEHYGLILEATEHTCSRDGADACRFHVHYQKAA